MVSLIATLHVLGIKATERLRREETGATAVEYGLLVGLLAVVITGLMLVFGPQLQLAFTKILPAVPAP
ncbi:MULTISPECIES: Flp family type IVb pilin [unclassified Arthrobacter]|uniref:Flp family type IVb pilin n=1 Tax=unclassified Arthrobacter TaxID=235627 RepID=UPI0014931093|nr:MULTISPECIES: Flp family type IVb pilin [unclassified Arthrobacter]MBE0008815.1 Flp family type IVb pilin [Arthrobacter sp. AET 35A]NOJ62705.1 Flp family type IVb pilin [Arthrobacter sp. 147(2020)]